jgi:hypothetical protein
MAIIKRRLDHQVSGEVATFAKLFSRHVGPLLERRCETMALFVLFDLCTFTEAHGSVMATAVGRGALHLSSATFDDLDELIAGRLLLHASSREQCVSHAQLVADRAGVDLRPWLREDW